jgi:FkbM family methyltransferase
VGIGTRKLVRRITKQLSPTAYCRYVNFILALKGRKIRLHPMEAGHYKVTDPRGHLAICRRERHVRSKNGIDHGIAALAAVYHLDKIGLSVGDLLIDCGANIGELGVWAKGRGASYIAFEPETLEADCCDQNAFGGDARTNRMALWHEEGELTFYSKPESADSSVFEIKKYNTTKTVPARRLDAVVDDLDSYGTIVLKVEAEGAEPEVLEGATGILAQIHYVTVDCGYERGVQQSHTFIEVNATLTRLGFRPKLANFQDRTTILYENVALVGSEH